MRKRWLWFGCWIWVALHCCGSVDRFAHCDWESDDGEEWDELEDEDEFELDGGWESALPPDEEELNFEREEFATCPVPSITNFLRRRLTS